MVYAVHTTKGYQVKGRICLDLDARVEMLPNTETMQVVHPPPLLSLLTVVHPLHC